jgi:endonuclease/exonuclease/phosphatase family metal-dependent hydrolase
MGKTARLESAKLIVQTITEKNAGKNYPVFVTGDFNSKPEEEPAQYMMSKLQNCRNASALVYGPADTWNGFKFGEKPSGCIDYVFASHYKYLNILKFATLTDSYDRKYPSDHFPVMATIRIDK